MSPETVIQLLVGALLAIAGATQMYMWKEIVRLRTSRNVHGHILQRHTGRFARIGEKLGIEWDDLEADLLKG